MWSVDMDFHMFDHYPFLRERFPTHVLTHNKEKKFTCGICSHHFLVASNLRRHMKNRHTNNKTFKCDKCPKEYKYRYVLQLHMKNKHNLEEKEENVESADQNQPIVKKEEVLFKERQTEFVCYVNGFSGVVVNVLFVENSYYTLHMCMVSPLYG
jgi:hypothetical protein